MRDNQYWKEKCDKLVALLRLPNYPVAFSLLKNRSEIPEEAQTFDKKMAVCQLIAYSRMYHWIVAGTPEKMVCAVGAACLGLIRTPERIKSGEGDIGYYVKNGDAAKKFQEATPKLGDEGKIYDAFVVAPLDVAPIDPQAIIIYASPARITRLIHSIVYHDGNPIHISTVCEAAVCTSIAKLIKNGNPVIDFPCIGDRAYGGVQDNEMLFVFPPDMIDKIIEGLEKTHEAGVSAYPVKPFLYFEPVFRIKSHMMTDEDLK